MLNARFLRLRAATVVESVRVVTNLPSIAERASSPSPAGAMLTWGRPKTLRAAAAVAAAQTLMNTT
jgi:hypothetical protein